eukprot:scaffold101368_cov63-Phaeocystis_antarctica.AAC.1
MPRGVAEGSSRNRRVAHSRTGRSPARAACPSRTRCRRSRARVAYRARALRRADEHVCRRGGALGHASMLGCEDGHARRVPERGERATRKRHIESQAVRSSGHTHGHCGVGTKHSLRGDGDA